MSIIEINNLTKEFKLGQLKSLKHTALNAFDRFRGKTVEKPKRFKALDDVSFRVEPGEVLGIIGQNGAGKSTMLKMLAGISTPTRGEVKVRGSVAPLIEVGAGLIGDLTGRENIFLNGSVLGLSRAEIKRKFDEIVAFAELEEFIETPIKRYSSGMSVRLGFAIATSVDADILIVDEVLAVGDLAFQRKCFDRMEDMIKRQGKTVILVSHSVRQVERICGRAILLDHGTILADDRPKNVCNLFFERNDKKIKNAIASSKDFGGARYNTSGDVELLNISLLDKSGKTVDKIMHNDDVTVTILYKTSIELVRPTFGIGVHTTDFLYLATDNSHRNFADTRLAPGVYEARCRIKKFPFLPGVYSLRLGISSGEIPKPQFYAENLLHFQVEGEGVIRGAEGTEGFVPLDASWENNVSEGSARLEAFNIS
jgi:lipopolysaccharide transport system ATP-binding protein